MATDTSVTPDKRRLTRKQASYLSEQTDINAEKLAELQLSKVHKLLRWKIKPELLLFRRICGRVLKTDPGSGELHPVPNATVHVEDTDCSFLGFFPADSPWSWFYPYNCRREEITTVTTDACGRFCVYIPRWDIDRILRFRRKRVCWPEIRKPDIRDILEWPEPLPAPPVIHPPGPRPDQVPEWIKHPDTRERIRELLGTESAERLEGLLTYQVFGEETGDLEQVLASPALVGKLPPPLPSSSRGTGMDRRKEELAKQLSIRKKALRSIDFSRYIGPLWRCRTTLVPEWTTIADIPDITFRVTQDVDGDGNEETIYSEGFFDVRWNADPLPDVVLLAGQIALSTPGCGAPDIDTETCSRPELRTAGLMTLEPTHHDAAAGYALRPNRPKPGGFWDSPSAATGKAPYCKTLQLHGCHRFENAKYYRLVYQYGAASAVPFSGIKWYAPRLGPGAPIHIVPDANGWYPILPAGDLVFPHWLLNWNTRSFANGLYQVRLELGDNGKNVIDQSSDTGFMVDNSKPYTEFTEIRWRVKGGGSPGTLLPAVCPVIRRPAGSDIEISVKYFTSADHFRDVRVYGYGCGAGGMGRALPANRGRYEHWHINTTTDTHWGQTAVFDLSGANPEGVYTVRLLSYSRAFNPAGSGGGPATDWLYNPGHLWSHPARSIAVIDA